MVERKRPSSKLAASSRHSDGAEDGRRLDEAVLVHARGQRRPVEVLDAVGDGLRRSGAHGRSTRRARSRREIAPEPTSPPRYRQLAMPQITSSVATNGLPIHRVALTGTRATTILVAFDAGARTERPDENGMAHFLEHLVFKGGADLRRLPQGQRDGRAHGRLAERLHLARPRRLPHHRARRGGDGGDRPAHRLRRAPEDRPRRARQGARRRHPGDPALQGPARRRGRGAHRPRALRRPSAGPHRAGPRGPPADLLARGDRRLPRAALVRRARRRVRRRQRRPRAGQRQGRRALRRASPTCPSPSPTCRRRRFEPGRWSSSATPTSRTCA